MGNIGDPTAIPALREVLNRGPDELRQSAARALAKTGWQPQAPAEETEFFVAMDSWDKAAAAGRSAAPPLIRILRSKTESSTRKSLAAQTLLKIGWQPQTPQEKVIFYLPQGSLEQIADVGEPAVPALVTALSEPSESNLAVTALGRIGSKAAIEALVDILGNAHAWYSEDLHHEAASALVAIAQPAFPRLIDTLGSPNASLRASIVEILLKIGRPGLPGLVAALSNGKYDVQESAAYVLGEIGDQSAVPALLEAMKNEHFYGRRDAAKALLKLGWQPQTIEDSVHFYLLLDRPAEVIAIGRQAVPVLLEAGRKNIPTLDVVAILGKLGDKRAVPALLSALKDAHDDEVRIAAAHSLEEVHWEPQNLNDKVLVDLVLQRPDQSGEMGLAALSAILEASKVASSELRKTIVAALVHIGQPGIPYLVKALMDKDADDRVRWTSQDALRALDWQPQTVEEKVFFYLVSGTKISDHIDRVVDLGQAAVPCLLEALKHDKQIDMSAAHALNTLGWQPPTVEDKVLFYLNVDASDKIVEIGPPAVPALGRALGDNRWLRDDAERALGEIRNNQAVPPLLQALKEGDVGAAEALAEIGDAGAFPGLLAAFLRYEMESYDHRETWRYAHALARFRDARAVPALLEATKHDETISHSMSAIIDIGAPAVPVLLQELDPKADLGHQAASARILGIIGNASLVPRLSEVAHDEGRPGAVRAAAIEALGWLGDKTLVALAFDFLRTQDEVLRRSAGLAIGHLRDPTAVAALMDVFREDRSTWPYVAGALADIATTDAVRALIEINRVMADDGRRFPLVRTIGAIGDRAAVAALAGLVRNGNKDAAEALGEIGDDSAVPALIEALDTDDENLTTECVQTLEKLDARDAVPALLHLNINMYPNREFLIFALGTLGGKAMIPTLLDTCRNAGPEERRAALVALEGVADKSLVPEMLGILRDREERPDVRAGAVYVLGHIGDKAVARELVEVLKHGDPQYEMHSAARALGDLGFKEAVPALLDALTNNAMYVEDESARALGKIGDKAAIPMLREIRQRNRDNVTVLEALARLGDIDALLELQHRLEFNKRDSDAAKALGESGDKSAAPLLIKVLAETGQPSYSWNNLGNCDETRRAIVEALGKIGTESAVPALLEAAKDRDVKLRRLAVESLGQVGGRRALGDLREALQDPNVYVVKSAKKALGISR